MDGRIKRVKQFTLVTAPTIDVRFGRLIASSNMRAIIRAIRALSCFKIRTKWDQVHPDEDRKSSQLLELVRLEDQEDGIE